MTARLVRNELYKLVRWRTLAIFALFTLTIVVLNLHSYTPGGSDTTVWTFSYGQSVPLATIEIFAQLMIIFLPVFLGDTIANDYRQGTLKLSLLRPITRNHLLGAKVVSLFVFICMTVLFFVAGTYAAGMFYLGWGAGTEYAGAVYSPLHGIVLTIGSYLLLIAPLMAYGLGVMAIAVLANQVSLTVIASLVLMTLLLNLNEWERVARYSIAYYVANFHELFVLGVDWAAASLGSTVVVLYAAAFYLLSRHRFAAKQVLY